MAEYNPSFPQTHAKEIGRLSDNMSNRRDGKKILEWSFSAPGRKASVTVEVSIVTGKEGLHFVARAPELQPAVEGSDIQALYKDVELQLRLQVGSLANIAWEDWFEIKVSGGDSDFHADSPYAALGAELKVHVSRLARGIHPETGKLVTVNTNHVLVPFPAPRRFEENPGAAVDTLTGYRLNTPVEVAYLPATPENEAALRDILDRLRTLRVRMTDLMQQDGLQERLRDLASQSSLLAPPRA